MCLMVKFSYFHCLLFICLVSVNSEKADKVCNPLWGKEKISHCPLEKDFTAQDKKKNVMKGKGKEDKGGVK